MESWNITGPTSFLESYSPEMVVFIVCAAAIFLILCFTIRKRKQKALAAASGPATPEKEQSLARWQTTFVIVLLVVLFLVALKLIINYSLIYLPVFAVYLIFLWVLFPWALTDIARVFKDELVNSHVFESTTTFQEVGGLAEIIEELKDVVEYLKNPADAVSWGIRPPRGVLLTGPPGCGKTLLAKAVAGEAEILFFEYAGSEFVDKYVGVGASNIRSALRQAKSSAPSVIFIDELDAVGKKRGTTGDAHEYDHALTQLLHELDGIRQTKGVLLIAATNLEEVIDPALLRRFDKTILVPRPDLQSRVEIIRIHTKNKPLADEIVIEVLAKRLAGFTGAALEILCNEAALVAKRRSDSTDKKKEIISPDFEEAQLKVMMGPSRELVISQEERELIAYHEVGHALAAVVLGQEVLEKVTLMSRKWSLGLTVLHSQERQTQTKPFLVARLTTLLAGRAAEEEFFGDSFGTGAAHDFESTAAIARSMVCEWGMGDLGPEVFCKLDTSSRLGNYPLSEASKQKIDEEVGRIISACKTKAREIITQNKDLIKQLAALLIEKETLGAEEIISLYQESKNPVQ